MTSPRWTFARREGSLVAVGSLLIDKQEIADQQRRHHGRRGDAEWLNGKGDDEDRHDDDREQGLQGEQQRILRGCLSMGGQRLAVGQRLLGRRSLTR